MTRYTRRRRWIEAVLTAVGAGCVAVGLQPPDAHWHRQLTAFMGAALPVLAVHARHGQAAPEPPAVVKS